MERFSKDDTLVVKGIAVLMLVFHHFFMGIAPHPLVWSFDKVELGVNIATLCKVCVAIFVVLSGYGINESYKRKKEGDFAFVKNHLLKLMKQYWFIFLIFVPLGIILGANPVDVYGKSPKGVLYFIIDFFGMKSLMNTPTMNQTWWYMETVIVLYALFPILKKLTKKVPYIILPISFLPVVKFGLLNNGSIDGCREIYWVFHFCAGILLSEKNILNKYSSYLSLNRAKVTFLSIVSLLIFTILRSRYGIIMDCFFAISIILAIKATLCNIKYLSSSLRYLGVHSANIFMMHSFLYCYYTQIKFILTVLKYPLINYAILISECVIVSDYLEITKSRLNNVLLKIRMTRKDLKLTAFESDGKKDDLKV